MSRRLITDVASGTKTRKESNIAEKADVLGVCLIGKRIPSGSYRAVCSGSVVRNLSKFNSEKVFVITSDIIVGGRQSGQNTLITKDYRLYFKKWDSTNELKVYELHEVTSSKENDNIHLISGLAIIPIDAKKLRRRSGILKYRPFTSEETECSSLGGSVCQIVAGNTDAFAVTPYDLENDSGEYVLKLPEKGISFKTWTELTGGGANSSSLHPRGAVFLRHGKAVGFLTFLNGSGKIAPVCSSHSLLQAGSGTDVTTTNQEGIEAGTSAMVSEDLDVFTQQNVDVDGADEASSDSARQNLSDTEEQGPSRSTASGQQGSKGSDVTTTNQEGIKAGTSAMVSEDLDVHTQQNVDDEPLIYRRRRDSADFPGIPGITADVRSKGRGRGTLTDIPGTTEVRGRGRGASKMEKPTQYNGRESIRIEEQPSSQKQKEGSRVVLRCKIQGRNDVSYQWLKDGEDLKGQNSSTLVLNPVQLCDFGFYVCKVRCTDNSASSICVESSPAELNVTPRDGMRFKQLSEIRLTDAGDRLEKLLSIKIHGLGGWKQVAIKYKMDELNIKLLEGDPQAGASVLTYLAAHNPDLTVYEFCKFLKESNIRRHDIVKGLLDHLSVTL